LRENVRDGLAAPRGDDVVRIEESEVQLIGDHTAHGGFARAHEADEGDVVNKARGAHRNELDDLYAIDTQFLVIP